MKVIRIDEANIKECVKDAQHERVLRTTIELLLTIILGLVGTPAAS